MATELAAYNAAPTPSIFEPVGIYVCKDGAPFELAGLEDFDLTVENPADEHYDPPQLDIEVAYDPDDVHHRGLREACASGDPVVIRMVLRDRQGIAVECQEFDCTVKRCRVTVHDRASRRDNSGRRLVVSFDLEATGGFHTIA